MEIKFGAISNNPFRAIILRSTLGMVFTCCDFRIQDILDDSHEALLQSSMLNVSLINIGFFCGIPYDDCRCSVQSTKNVYLKHCLTDNFLLGSRIFRLVSFILQICLIRDLFTFSGKYTRFVIYGLWTTAVFIFVIIANGIYRSSCFHRQINGVSSCTGAFLFGLVVHDLLSHIDIVRYPSNDHNAFNCHSIINDQTSEEITNDQTSEEITNEPIAWQDLL